MKRINLRTILATCSVALLSACTGMYMGVEAEDETLPELTQEQINARIEIHKITPQSIQQLRLESQADEGVKRARLDMSQLQPDKDIQPYKIAPSDVLLITVWNYPELNNPAGQLTNDLAGRTVAADGYFYYPYAGRVKAAGRTTEQIRVELTRRLTDYLTEPQIDVGVLKYRSKKAYVLGQVEKPGAVPITDDPLYVTSVISQAGGLQDDADLTGVLLNRNGAVKRLNLYDLYYKGDFSQNLLLQDGDIINVPERTLDKIFVLGEVRKPYSQVLPWDGFTLADALGEAEGVDPVTSKASQVYVIRAVDEDRPQVWHLNASSPAAFVLADSFQLQPRDVVFVDAANVTRWSRVINQILPTATGLTNITGRARTSF